MVSNRPPSDQVKPVLRGDHQTKDRPLEHQQMEFEPAIRKPAEVASAHAPSPGDKPDWSDFVMSTARLESCAPDEGAASATLSG